MVFPKEFQNFQDLQAMLLTCLLGTLISLKEDLISIEQAKRYWLNDVMLDVITDFEASDEIIMLLNDCIDLVDKDELDLDALQNYIDKCKEIIGQRYTNYDEIDVDLIN